MITDDSLPAIAEHAVLKASRDMTIPTYRQALTALKLLCEAFGK